VTLRYRGHIGWNSWKIISRLTSLTFPQYHGSTPKGTPQILAGIGVGNGKNWRRTYKTGRNDWRPIKSTWAFDCRQNIWQTDSAWGPGAVFGVDALYKLTFYLLTHYMTLNDLWARFKVTDSLNAAKMTKYSPTPCRVVGCIICIRPTYSAHVHLLTYFLTQLAYTTIKLAISPKRLKIERKLLLTAFMKSYTGFRLPPKCMTLNDLWMRLKIIDSLNVIKMTKYLIQSGWIHYIDLYLTLNLKVMRLGCGDEIWRQKTKIMGPPCGEEITIVGWTTRVQSTSVTDRQTDRFTMTKTALCKASCVNIYTRFLRWISIFYRRTANNAALHCGNRLP